MVDKFGEAQPLKEGSSVCRYCYCEVKQWVSLTDEEVSKYFEERWTGYSGYFSCFEEVMKWAEEKLRIKNG
jgi:hypothetical protein